MTNEEINKLSDDQLNLAIMSKLGLTPIETWETYQEDNQTVHACTHKADPVDYCNNWNDLMPLVDFDYSVTKHVTGLFDVIVNYTTTGAFNVKTKQRGLAECLLQVLIAKGEYRW